MLILSAFLAGLVGAMGLGGGGILMLYLVTLDITQRTAQGINLFLILPVGVVGLLFHIKNKLVNFTAAIYILSGGFFGVLVGSFVAKSIDNQLLRQIFAILFILLGGKELYSAYKILKTNQNQKNIGKNV